jgi:hypothetical protein
MRAEVYLHRLLPIVSILAALGPGLQALKMFRARDLVRTITQYGPLPQIHIPFVDYLTLSLAIMLLVAVIMEIARLRLAAPIALTIITALWLYYIPGIWEEVTGNVWFTTRLGRSTGITWQMLTYQTLSMLCAAVLTVLRFRQQDS